MSDSLYRKFYEIAKSVPAGYVASYGDIAAASGNPRRSRIVGAAMACCPDGKVPCHRVVYADGSISENFGVDGARYRRFLLESEGVTFLSDGRVDMSRHRWVFDLKDFG